MIICRLQKNFSQMFVEKRLNFQMQLERYYNTCGLRFYSLLIRVKICGWQEPVGYNRAYFQTLTVGDIGNHKWNTVGYIVLRCLKLGLLSKWLKFNICTFVIFYWDMYFYNVTIEVPVKCIFFHVYVIKCGLHNPYHIW